MSDLEKALTLVSVIVLLLVLLDVFGCYQDTRNDDRDG